MEDWEYDELVGDTENQDPEVVEDKQLEFVQLLKKYKVLLDKSQVPAVKTAKKNAASLMLAELELNLAMNLTEPKLMKKINNMKTKIKEKTDMNKTGNKKILLSTWEKEFLLLVQADSNPVFNRIPGAKSVGAQPNQTLGSTIGEPEPRQSTSSAAAASVQIPPRPPAAKKRKTGEDILAAAETEDTKLLSTAQLQRLVLLEQLKLIKMKQDRPHVVLGEIVDNTNSNGTTN